MPTSLLCFLTRLCLLPLLLLPAIAQTDLASLAVALDLPSEVQLSTSGNTPWTAQTLTTHDGVDAAQCGPLTADQSSSLSFSFSGHKVISFFWKSSAANDQRVASFYIDGEFYTSISRTTEWKNVTFTLPAGNHTATWTFQSFTDTPVASGTFWVDQITITDPFYFTVTFDLGEHGTTTDADLLVQRVILNGYANPPYVEAAPGWDFDDWDVEYYEITSDRTVRARYVPVVTPLLDQSPTRVMPTAPDVWAVKVAASGRQLTYQWFRGATGDTSQPVPGATSPLLLQRPLTTATTYWVRIRNSAGTIDSPDLTVQPTPTHPGGYTLRGMGNSFYGQLGLGKLGFQARPEQKATDVLAIAVGDLHSLWIKTDHSLWAVGTNSSGQLGDGTTTDRLRPVRIAEAVTAVAVGDTHSLFIKADHTLWAMGYLDVGWYSSSSNNYGSKPVHIASAVTAVAAGYGHTCFLKTDGSLWFMGRDRYGLFAGHSFRDDSIPVQIATGVRSLSAGPEHLAFIKTDGSLWAFGRYDFSYNSPTSLPPDEAPTPFLIATEVVSASVGYHISFIKTDGTLWALGDNSSGQLGDGTTIDRAQPVAIAADVASVSAGYDHTLFAKTDGSLWATGFNGSGELGDGFTFYRSTPVQVAHDVGAVAAKWNNSFYIKKDHTLWAMGANEYGQFGDGTLLQADQLTPATIATGVTAIKAGRERTYFTRTDRSLWAMGNSTMGQLGDGYTLARATPVPIATEVTQFFTGYDDMTFFKSAGSLWTTSYTETNPATKSLLPAPVELPGVTLSEITAIDAGGSRYLKNDGSLWYLSVEGPWLLASNVVTTNGLVSTQAFLTAEGMLGLEYFYPPRISDVVTFAVSNSGLYKERVYYIKSDGSLWIPRARNKIDSDVLAVAAGDDHTLYIKNDHSLWAMGNNNHGQLGDGTRITRNEPVPIATRVVAVAAGREHSVFLQDPELPTPYALWAAAIPLKGTLAAPGADPDRDGLPNLLEYYLGTAPNVADPAVARPTTTLTTQYGRPYLTLTHRHRKDAAAPALYQKATQLGDDSAWETAELTPVRVNFDVDGDGLVELLQVSLPLDGAAQVYLRLVVAE